MWYNTVQYNATYYYIILRYTILYDIIPYHTIPCYITLHYIIVMSLPDQNRGTTWHKLKFWYYAFSVHKWQDFILHFECGKKKEVRISGTFWSQYLEREFSYFQARAEFLRQCLTSLPPNMSTSESTAESTDNHLGSTCWGTSNSSFFPKYL